MKLSIIIPTFNEESNEFYSMSLISLSRFKDIEIIISDGGSSDNTLEQAKQFGATIIHSSSSRGERLDDALKIASSNFILLHHPRSFLDPNGVAYLIENTDHLSWGGFTHHFDDSSLLLKFTSWYSNEVRAKIRGIVYLDHCIFFKRSLLSSLPRVRIFEDTLISYLLLKVSHPEILDFESLTSSIRFRDGGLITHSLKNQILKLKFSLGHCLEDMNRDYELNLNLNGDYLVDEQLAPPRTQNSAQNR